MERIDADARDRAAQFVWRTGSLVDQRRMAHLAGAGTGDQVRDAVLAHRTGDGGSRSRSNPT
nr:hypothetical protein GCM10025732_37760 [Glycomyces mayteni]